MHKIELSEMIERYKNEMIKSHNKAVPVVASVTDDPQSVPSLETYEQFLKSNPKKGTLKVQAFTAKQAFPVPKVNVKVTKTFLDTTKTFFDLVTDESGVIDGMELPAPDKSLSENENYTGPVYETYDIQAMHPDYEDVKLKQVAIFDGVKSIQPIALIPKS